MAPARDQQHREGSAALDAGALRHIWRWAGDKFPREDSSEPSRALPKPGGFAFPRPSGRPADSAAHDLAKRLDRGLTSTEATVGGSHASQARASPEKGSGGKAAKRHS